MLVGVFLKNRKTFLNNVLMIGGFPLSLFMPSLVIGGINCQGAFLLILFLLVLASAIMNFPHLIKASATFYLSILLIILSFISLIWAPSLGEAISMTVKYMMPILFIILILSVVKSHTDILRCEKSIITCGIILIVLGILNKLSGGFFDSVEGKIKWANTMVLLAPYKSPANYSFMLGMCALLSIANYFNSKKKLWLVLFVLFFAAVILAFTRISMMAVLFSSMILYGIAKRSIFITYIAPAVAFVTAIAAVVFIKPLRDRMFFDGEKMDLSLAFTNFPVFLTHVDTSGRTSLWLGALEYFKNSNALIGAGSGSTDYWVKNHSTALALHSDFLRLYFDLGIIGLCLFLLSFIQIIMVSCSSPKNKFNKSIHLKYKSLCIAAAIFYFITLFTDNTLNYVTDLGIYLYAFIGFATIIVLSKRPLVLTKKGVVAPLNVTVSVT